MISKPSASWSSVMHSGGFVWIELFGAIVYRPLLAEELADRLHLVRRAVERGQRRPRVPAANEVEDPEQPEVAVRPDRRMLRGEPLVVARITGPSRGRVADQVVLLVDAEIVARDAARLTGWLL